MTDTNNDLETPPSADTLTELPEVAKTIFLECKKCEADRYFKVLAHSTAKSAKVQCEVCGAKKTFRLKAPKKKTTRKRKVAKTPEQIWLELKDQVGADSPSPYSMGATFESETAIEHPKFGVGIVTAANPVRIDVVFQDGERALVHNRG